jgi:pilus assembly protein CpaE
LAGLIRGETLRVLLIGTDEEIRAAAGDALARSGSDHRLFWVSQPDLAPGRASDLIPHVILIDDELAGTSVAGLINLLVQRAPRAAILVLVDRAGVHTAQAAMLAGARGFLVKPLEGADLLNAVRQVLAASEPARPSDAPAVFGRIVAFCAPKGGTGRTTLAINTTIALQQITKRAAAIVDADYAAPALDVALNLDAGRNIVDLLPKLSRLDADLVSSVLAAHASGIRVLLAPPPADLAHPISLPQVQQVLATLKRMFPWVVVDLGLPMDDTAFAFLDSADRIVMTVLPEMVGLRNTRLMLDQLHERGYPAEKIWLVLNRADMRGGVSVTDIEERLRVRVRYKIPDDQALATHSVNRGVPVMMSHSDSRLGKGVRVFAGELAREVIGADAFEPAAGGLFGRLRGRPATAES